MFDDRAAAILRLRRRRGLITHAAVFAVVQIALIAIWAVDRRRRVLLAGLDDLRAGACCSRCTRRWRSCASRSPTPRCRGLRPAEREFELLGRARDLARDVATVLDAGLVLRGRAAASVRISQSGVRSGSSTWPTGGHVHERASCSPRTCDMLFRGHRPLSQELNPDNQNSRILRVHCRQSALSYSARISARSAAGGVLAS